MKFNINIQSTFTDYELYELIARYVKPDNVYTRFVIGIETINYRQEINNHKIIHVLRLLSNNPIFTNLLDKYIRTADAHVLICDLSRGQCLDEIHKLHYDISSNNPNIPILLIGVLKSKNIGELEHATIFEFAKDLKFLDYFEIENSDFSTPFELLGYVLLGKKMDLDVNWNIEENNFVLFKGIVEELL